MQALFILSLFGIVYSTVAVITTMLATSAMQLKHERIQDVEQMFIDIESGITKGYLGVNVDFSGISFTMGGNNRIDGSIAAGSVIRVDEFVPEFISWTGAQLIVDPWKTNYYMEVHSRITTIYADNDMPPFALTNTIQAPISVFVMVSAGPDKQFGTVVMPGTFDGARRYTKAANANGEDDIVHVFTTFSAMSELWSYTQDIHEKIITIAVDDYKQQYELFRPTIDATFTDIVNFYDASYVWQGDGNAAGCSTPLIHAWRDPACNVPNVVGGNLADPVLYPGFPEFVTNTEDLGVDNIEASLPPGLISSLNINRTSVDGLNNILDISLSPTGANDWAITYEKRLDGKEIISGL